MPKSKTKKPKKQKPKRKSKSQPKRKKTAKPRRMTRTTRAKMERMLGRKLLSGEIPVVSPRQLRRCPIPRNKETAEICDLYEKGEIDVTELLEKAKKPEPEPTYTHVVEAPPPEYRVQEPQKKEQPEHEPESEYHVADGGSDEEVRD